MATSSILGGTRVPAAAQGNDTNALGPSDNSDSGSDAQGAYGSGELAADSDAAGTGERATAGDGMEKTSEDILPDHIENAGGVTAAEDIESEDATDLDGLAQDDDDVDGDDDQVEAEDDDSGGE